MKQKIQHSIKKYIYHARKILLFKSSHISFGGKIALLGVVICFISLFHTWVGSSGAIVTSGNLTIESFNSFSSVLGRIGFFVLFTLMIIVFSIFSIQKKQRFHYFSLIYISDYFSSLIGSIFILLLSIHSFLLIGGLQLFSSEVTHGRGIILSITGSLVILISTYLMKQEHRKNIKGSYINDIKPSVQKMSNETQRDNMKLPF